MHPFRAAVEAGDQAAIEALLAEDVVFTSPVAFRPYPGKMITAAILRAVLRVFGEVRYVRELASEDGRDHALVFETMVAGKALSGCDFLHTNDDGLIDQFTVMVRPLSAANALSEAMAVEFEQVKREVAATAGS
jgi:ketosteroid isomerase-like protein